MKKIKIVLLMLAIVAIMLPACKKGADDPFLSFRSRDARMEGNWSLTSISGTTVSKNLQQEYDPYTGMPYDTTITTTDSYNGLSVTQTTSGIRHSSGSTPIISTGTYSMTISKKSVVSWSSSYTASGSTADIQSGTGQWFWLNSDKKKEDFYVDGGGELFNSVIYYVDKCSHETMILETNSSNAESQGNTNTNSTSNLKYTFTRQ